MISKQTAYRQKEAQAILSAGEIHRPEIASGLKTLFSPLLQPGEKLPDFSFLVTLGLRCLDRALSGLLTADNAYQAELLDDPPYRKKRDEDTAALRQCLISARDALVACYGESVLDSTGFTITTPTDSTQLGRYATQVSDALKSTTMPAPRLPGLTLNPIKLGDNLAGLRKRLDQSLADVQRETREAQAAHAVRQDAEATFDQRLADVASLVVTLLRLAGKPELAERVRQVWRTPPADDPAVPAPPAPPADPAPPARPAPAP